MSEGPSIGTVLTTVALAIIGTATLSVIFSSKSNTPKVIAAAGSALATNIQAAVGPVTGSSPTLTTGSSIGLGTSGITSGLGISMPQSFTTPIT